MTGEDINIETPAPVIEEITIDAGELVSPDPGLMEGVKAKPTDNEPPPDHPRWKQVYAKLKDTERKLAEKDTIILEGSRHNKELWGKLESLTGKAIDSFEAIASQGAAQDAGRAAGDMDHQMAALEEQLAQARDLATYDPRRAVAIEKQIRALEREAATPPATKPAVDPSATTDAQLDPDVAWFMGAAPWFNDDPLMTGAAKELDVRLARSPEWQGKSKRSRFAEVKKVVEEKFGDGNGDNGKTAPKAKPGSAVESGSLGADGGRHRVVKLTAEEMALARGFGIDYEQLARQKAAIKGEKDHG